MRYGAAKKYGAWYGAKRDRAWSSVIEGGLENEKTLENQGFQRVSVPPQGVVHSKKNALLLLKFGRAYGAQYGARISQVFPGL